MIKKTNFFSDITFISPSQKQHKINTSWVDFWNKSHVRPTLNGGMGIIKCLENSSKRIKELFQLYPSIQEVINNTDDYDFHVSVKPDMLIELAPKIIDQFDLIIKMFTDFLNENDVQNKYQINKRNTNRITTGGINSNKLTNLKRLQTVTYLVVLNKKVVFETDVSIVTASHIDYEGNSMLSITHSNRTGFPIKTRKAYMIETMSILLREHFGKNLRFGDELAVSLRNPIIGKKVNKGKKSLIRAYLLAWIIHKLEVVLKYPRNKKLTFNNTKLLKVSNKDITSFIYDLVEMIGILKSPNAFRLNSKPYNKFYLSQIERLLPKTNDYLTMFDIYKNKFSRANNTHYL